MQGHINNCKANTCMSPKNKNWLLWYERIILSTIFKVGALKTDSGSMFQSEIEWGKKSSHMPECGRCV